MAAVRVRFAPSPTGKLHLGGARTALFNYLFAKANNGALVLRIEDTDRERHIPEAERNFTDILSWLGIRFTEGPGSLGGSYGPYVQSQRLKLYHQYASHLIKKDAAYPCFCSRERLADLRIKGERSGYDGCCQQLPRRAVEEKLEMGLPHTIRMKVPDCKSSTIVRDFVYGGVEVDHATMDDFVLLKSNGYPTYHLACVVDDHCMEISHVLRGEEWLLSTAKHLLLYTGMEWKPPQFVHLPLLLSNSGGKLSKRNEDTFVQTYKTRGYLPEAIVNFIALLGWSPAKNRGAGIKAGADIKGDAKDTSRELFTMEELIAQFSLAGIKRTPVTVDEAKLHWINKYHYRRKLATSTELGTLARKLKQHLLEQDDQMLEGALASEEYLTKLLVCLGDRVSLLPDVVREAGYFWTHPAITRKTFATIPLGDDAKCQVLLAVARGVAECGFSREELDSMLRGVARRCEVPYRHVMALSRLSLTGLQASPGVAGVMEVLGREMVLQRLHTAANTLQ